MRNLCVKNLPRHMDTPGITRLVKELAQVECFTLMRGRNGKSRRIALVSFDTEEAALSAMSVLQGATVDKDGDIVKATTPELAAEAQAKEEAGEADPKGDSQAVLRVVFAARELEEAFATRDERQRATKEKKDLAVAMRPHKQKEEKRKKDEEYNRKKAQLHAEFSREERLERVVRDRYEATLRRMETVEGGRCFRCWLYARDCICVPTPPEVLRGFAHRVIVYLHPKEMGRFSNTGALVQSAFPPEQTVVYIAGLPEHERAMREECEADPRSVMALFPSEDSITVAEFVRYAQTGELPAGDREKYATGPSKEGEEESLRELALVRAAQPRVLTYFGPLTREEQERRELEEEQEKHGKEHGQEGAPPTEGPGKRLTIIVVDGTWHQARRMGKNLPKCVQRVRLQPTSFDSLYNSPMRTQATPDRVCSLTAFVLLLRELLPDDTVAQHCLQVLHRKSVHVLKQSNKEWKATNGVHSNHPGFKELIAASALPPEKLARA